MDAFEMAEYIARTMYTNEFCSVCGCAIVVDAPKTTVSTDNGGGSRVLRPAHQACAVRQMPEKTLAYSI